MAFANARTASPTEKKAPKWTARPNQSIMLQDANAETIPAEVQARIDEILKTQLPKASKDAIIADIRKAARPAKGKPITLTPHDPIPGAGEKGSTAPMSWKLDGIGGGVWMSEEQWLTVLSFHQQIRAAIEKRRDS